MFTHRHRYLFIFLLGAYSYLNTVFSEVYGHYGILAEWYWCMLTVLLVTLAVWEGNRFIEKIIDRKFSGPVAWMRLAIFFAAGTILSAITAAIIFMLVAGLINHAIAVNVPATMKLTIMYATRINLFLHTINAVVVINEAYKRKELET